MAHDLLLHDQFLRGRSAWPKIDVREADFADYLRKCLSGPNEASDVAAGLPRLPVADLYLACACAQGNLFAIDAFEAHYVPQVSELLHRAGIHPSAIDEAKQVLRDRLFVPAPGALRKIADYGGRGSLAHWLGVVAFRIAIELARQGRKEVQSENPTLTLGPLVHDAELQYIKERYRQQFQDGFRNAFASLSVRDRNVLRLHLVDELSMQDIARRYRVNQSTVSRWITRSRHTLLRRTRELVQKELRIDRAEFDSLIRLLRSQLHLSLSLLAK